MLLIFNSRIQIWLFKYTINANIYNPFLIVYEYKRNSNYLVISWMFFYFCWNFPLNKYRAEVCKFNMVNHSRRISFKKVSKKIVVKQFLTFIYQPTVTQEQWYSGLQSLIKDKKMHTLVYFPKATMQDMQYIMSQMTVQTLRRKALKSISLRLESFKFPFILIMSGYFKHFQPGSLKVKFKLIQTKENYKKDSKRIIENTQKSRGKSKKKS